MEQKNVYIEGLSKALNLVLDELEEVMDETEKILDGDDTNN